MISAASAAKLDNWIESRRVADGTPGVSLAIIDRDGAVHERAYGLANLDAGLAMSPAHLFQTGSIGKSFTAIALLQLQEEGKVDLQAPVTDYLPWFAVPSEFEPIRLHHLLTHTAGITSGIDYAPDARIQVWGLRETWTTTPPGTFFHYSNIGYKVLGLVLERVSGTPYKETIATRILDRLHLFDSYPTIVHEFRDLLAVGYQPAAEDRPWWPEAPLAPATWFETDTADGCLAMTASDLSRYLAALLDQGNSLISRESFALLTCKGSEFESETEPNWYGYGIGSSMVDGHQYIGHSGGMVGYHSRMIGDLETGDGVVALVNGPGSPSLIARTTLDFLRAEREGRSFDLPPHRDPTATNPAEYAGTFTSPDRGDDVVFYDDGDGGLRTSAFSPYFRRDISESRGPHSMVPLGDDRFGVDAGLPLRFAFEFNRQNGIVTSVCYGNECYVNEKHNGPAADELPEKWRPLPGRYRSHNPWLTSIDIVARNGRLWLLSPTPSDGFNSAEPLVPQRDLWFQLGEDPRVPEFIRFDTIVDGVAFKAVLSTGEFYRVAN